MRSACALALLLSAAACRKTEQPPAPAQVAAAVEARPPAPEPAREPTPAAPTAAPSPAPAPPVDAQASPARPLPQDPAEKPPDDNAIYRWVDAAGTLHFSRVEDIPASRRALAKVVAAGLSQVRAEPVESTTPAPAPEAGQALIPAPGPAAAAPPGDQPELDADGLPIPGTMKETAHTRTVNQATGGQQLDPASVERRRQEDLRRMNCRVEDGVTICG